MLAENIRDAKQADFIRRTVFERLNTGGQPLNHQELRNSLYSGPLNELLIELAGGSRFDRIWGIPPYEDHYRKEDGYIDPTLAANKLFRRMKDCEIVLRFFAFRDPNRIKGSVRSILDTYMKLNKDATTSEIQDLRDRFSCCLRTSHKIFGSHTFRIRVKGKWRHSQPLFDAVMVAIDRLADHETKLIANRRKIRKALLEQTDKEDIYEVIVGRPNTANAVKNRITIVHDLLKEFC